MPTLYVYSFQYNDFLNGFDCHFHGTRSRMFDDDECAMLFI